MRDDQAPDLWQRRSSSFGGLAAEYAEHRPDYAPAAIAWVLEDAGRDAVDLGAGTGSLTSGLVDAGCRVTAVEPDPRMLDELRRRVPQARPVVAVAEAIPLPDGSVDVAVAGTAFHWFDRDRAMAEVARVLRPGGVLALFWNSDDTSVPWVAELGRLSRTSASTRSTTDDHRKRGSDHPAFTAVETKRFAHGQRRTAESMTVAVGTHSHTLVVEPEERADTLRRVRAFLDAQPETSSGEFELPLVTSVFRFRRRPG